MSAETRKGQGCGGVEVGEEEEEEAEGEEEEGEEEGEEGEEEEEKACWSCGGGPGSAAHLAGRRAAERSWRTTTKMQRSH